MVAQPAVKMFSRTSSFAESADQITTTAGITEGYTIVTDPGDSVLDVYAAPDLPVRGTPYPGTILLLTRRTPRQVSPIFWVVEVEYTGELGPDGESDSPVNRDPILTWQNVTSTEAIDEAFDENGNKVPITTVNGEPIDGVTKPVSDLRLTVDRNYLSINMPATIQYLDSVNSDSWPPGNAFSPGQAHLEAFDAKLKIAANNAQTYYAVRAEIMFRVPYHTTPAKAWWARVRHEGYRYKTLPPVEVVVNAIDAFQADVTRPILLDATGHELPRNGPGGTYDPADVVWLEFKRFQYELPYSALGLV